MNLAKAIEKDLMERVSDASLKEPLNRVAELHKRSAENMSERSVNPDGTPRKRLSERHRAAKRKKGLQANPDLYYTGTAQNSLDYRTQGKGIKFSYRDAKASEYMYDHEHGENGMPQRRYFPNESDPSIAQNDMQSAPQQENIREVEKILNEHFNQDRTIKVTSG